MLIMDARQFITLLHRLIELEQVARNAKGTLSVGDLENIAEGSKDIDAPLVALDLPVSLKVMKEMLLEAKTYPAAHQAFMQLFNTICLELDGRKFYGPLRKYERYYEEPKLFGDEVFMNFPSANEDIAEAGTCLALERPTATVMHMMRVVEAGLIVLAKAVGVTKQNDWGAYLREIEKALGASVKASGARSPDEQFYAEAATTFDNMRRAWRNPTMHSDRSYTLERAEEILQSVRSFMRHLATNLHE